VVDGVQAIFFGVEHGCIGQILMKNFAHERKDFFYSNQTGPEPEVFGS
jgi:hypothetical protein